MSLIKLKDLYYSVGTFPLFDHIDFDLPEGGRIALVGRNGTGKSTLLKMLTGNLTPDAGEIELGSNVKVARLEQELPVDPDLTVYETIAKGLASLSALLVEYHKLINQTGDHDDKWLSQLNRCQNQIEQQDGWQFQQRIEKIITDLALPADKKLADLSGGWKRRVALGAALVQEPDILLLDEPTNHLDLEAIMWLESFLLKYPKTLLFITHDRAFLRHLATRIIELDRGKLTSYPGDYDVYLKRKEQALIEEERQNALFDKKLSEEEAWIRQGIKARRTRNEGRVRALERLREERKQRQTQQGKTNFETNVVSQSSKLVIQAEKVSFGYTPDKLLVKDFTFNIQRGDKIAIVGANGSGKTTLLKLLIGQLKPLTGTIKQSPKNQIAFFDQTRSELHPTETCIDNVAEGDDFIEINGKRKHIIGYLGDFLFSPSKCRSLAKVLSGGEQNRLLLAKLFSKPANILVLDEPTNDLDIESLDVLEDRLLQYPGTVIIISHDREFIDNIATHCIGFEPDGSISIQVGGYSDWLKRKKNQSPSTSKSQRVGLAKKSEPTQPSTSKKRSYHEERELKALPEKIEALEQKIATLQDEMASPAFYQQAPDKIAAIQKELAELQETLLKLYERWEALE